MAPYRGWRRGSGRCACYWPAVARSRTGCRMRRGRSCRSAREKGGVWRAHAMLGGARAPLNTAAAISSRLVDRDEQVCARVVAGAVVRTRQSAGLRRQHELRTGLLRFPRAIAGGHDLAAVVDRAGRQQHDAWPAHEPAIQIVDSPLAPDHGTLAFGGGVVAG